MKAVVVTQPGGPEVLAVRDVADPSLPPQHVRVAVTHTAVNRADLLQRQGLYPAPPGVPADIVGLEYVGRVAELGAGVLRWRVGDRLEAARLQPHRRRVRGPGVTVSQPSTPRKEIRHVFEPS